MLAFRRVMSLGLMFTVCLGCGQEKPAASGSASAIPASASGGGATPAGDAAVRNPFGVKLEPVPDDEEVRTFAALVNLAGDDADPNAAAWPAAASAGSKDSLDGEWSGRWKYFGDAAPWVLQTEPTKVQTVGDRIYFLFTYHEGAYIMVTLRDGKDRLVGRFMSVRDPRDTGFYVGRIVGPDRIDGEWKGPSGAGRWDYRRTLQ